MFGEGPHASHIQRGIAEALTCQDRLERVPMKPTLVMRVIARLSAAVHTAVSRTPAGRRRVGPASSVTR